MAGTPALVQRAVVVGGGIGGLATGLALLRRGVDVRVVERAREFRAGVGAGFGLSPHGYACLASFGLRAGTDLIGHRLEHHRLWNARFDAELVSAAHSDHFQRLFARFGVGLYGTLRSELVGLLSAPLEKEGRLEYGREVVSVRAGKCGGEPAVVELRDGGRYEADLVVGADGVHSKVLQLIFPEGYEASPVESQENIFYGVIPGGVGHGGARAAGRPELFQAHTLLQNYGVFGEFVSFPAGNHGDLVWAQVYRAASGSREGADSGTDEWSIGGDPATRLRDFIASRGVPAAHPLREVAALTPTGRLMHFPLIRRAHQKLWHRGRIVLLGDSAHATLPHAGQGANQALEDAVVLADCLCPAPDDAAAAAGGLEQALARYQQRRHARTKRVVDAASGLASLALNESALRAAGTDALLWFLIRSGLFMKLAVKEIIEECPVPLKVIDHSAKF